MNKKTISIIFLTISLLGFAQNNRAKELLDKAHKTMNSYENIQIEFEYSLKNVSENIEQKTEGFLSMKGEKYKFILMGVTKLYDGQNLYTIIPDNEEVIVESNPDLENDFSPSNLIKNYEKGYSYKKDILQTISREKKIRYINLVPIKENTSNFRKLLIGIDIKTKLIHNIIQVGKNGTRTTLTLKDIKTNETLKKDEFVFNRAYYESLDYYIVEE